MAGGLFNRLKVWVKGDTVTYTDLNGEINNIIANLQPQLQSGYSNTVSQMQSTLSPGNVGSEVQAANLAQEFQELRFQVQQITGAAQWYVPPITTLSQLNTTINGVFPTAPNRIVSGAKTSFDQPYFVVPGITTPSVTMKSSVTPLLIYINGSAVSLSSDVTLSTLAVAPSANNTCIVNDPTLTGGQATKVQGEANTVLQIKTIGSNISALNGKYAAFKIGSEYFIGEVNTSNTQLTVTFNSPSGSPPASNISVSGTHGLSFGDQIIFTGSVPSEITAGTIYYAIPKNLSTFDVSATLGGAPIVYAGSVTTATGTFQKTNCIQKCFRGYFFDGVGNSIQRTTVTNGATVTLMQLTWIFATYNASVAGVDVTYNRPTTSYIAPTSPSIGDYWLDLSVNKWKKYSGSAFVVANAELIGVCIQDATNTVGARSFDFAQPFNSLNTMKLAYLDSADVRTSALGTKINVYGSGFAFDYSYVTWNTATNLDAGVTLAVSTQYFCYVSDLGDRLISDVAPYDRLFDLLGSYHPFKPWRCVGTFFTDGSSNVIASTITSVHGFDMLPVQSVYNANLAPGAVTTDKRGPLNYGVSYVDTSGVTALTYTLTTYGKPVYMGLIGDYNTVGTYANVNVSTPGSTSGLQFKRGATTLVSMNQRGASGNFPPGMYWFVDDNGGAGLPAGTYTYSVALGASTTTQNCRLICFELG